IVVTNSACYQARTVLVAVGGMGIVNQLGVPGETPARVSYLFRDALPYRDKNILVVGGGNSAAEAVLYLCDAGAKVTLVLRRSSLEGASSSGGAKIKPWVLKPLTAAIEAGKITALFNTQIVEILPASVRLRVDGKLKELAVDHIFALIGA